MVWVPEQKKKKKWLQWPIDILVPWNVNLLFSHSVTSNCVIPWTAAHQISLSFAIPWSLLKLKSIESVMPSNHLMLCHPLLLLPSIFPTSGSALCIRWSKYWSFSIFPTIEYSGLISLLSKGLSRVFHYINSLSTKFFGAQPSLWSNSHICM